MNNTWIIVAREYWTRVRRPAFLLGTFLTPLAIGLFGVFSGFLATYEGNDTLKLALHDPQHLISDSLTTKGVQIFRPSVSVDRMRELAKLDSFNAVLSLEKPVVNEANDYSPVLYADKPIGLEANQRVEELVEKALRQRKIEAFQLNKQTLKLLDTRVSLAAKPLSEGSDIGGLASGLSAILGGILGLVMYLAVILYGSMVMRSVMEEKMNRIVEVIISSVRPQQLMLGKIIGVGAVGLTQLVIWAILIPTVGAIAGLLLGNGATPQDLEGLKNMSGAPEIDPQLMAKKVQEILSELSRINWLLIVPLFFFYFLGGYFLYAALFAAVGSAVGDDMEQSQALTVPLTIPIVIGFYIMTTAARSPNSTLAVWASIFPLFSPLVMPTRLMYDPPLWQILASVLCLVLGCALAVWFAARVYRVGILMYGKKVTLKELWIWFRRAN